MDYPDPNSALADRARAFLDDHVIPAERAHPRHDRLPDDTRTALRQTAIDAGLYAPDAPTEYGGGGHDPRTALPVLEQAGRSPHAPSLLRVNSPDHANIHLLARHATPDQLDEWLGPLVRGDVRSAFAFTEPPPGAGSDPSMLETHANRNGNEWVLTGHKWWITQGATADLLIVAARTTPTNTETACTLFLVPADTPGVHLARRMGGVRRHGTGHHAELQFEDVRLPATAVLGDVHAGFRLARDRAHASAISRAARKTGMAHRALNIAAAYVTDRHTEGEPLAAKQAIRFELATAATRLHLLRTLIRDTTHRYRDTGATHPIDHTSLIVDEFAADIITTAATACGGHGVSNDLTLAEFLARTGPRNPRLTHPGAKERIADALLAAEAVEEAELDPMTRFTRKPP